MITVNLRYTGTNGNATMFSMLERDTRQFNGNIELMNRKDDEAEWGN